MIFPTDIQVFGDKNFRGECPVESKEETTFFNILRRDYPDSYGIIAFHVRNEGKRSPGQYLRHKAEGLAVGAADIVIPGSPSFVCEIKRKNHTLCKLNDNQIIYLNAARDAGAFVCIALGYEAALDAFKQWEMILL